MATLLKSSRTKRAPSLEIARDEQAASEVRSLLAGTYRPREHSERRGEQRYPYPRLLVLTPVTSDGCRKTGPSLTAAGKHLSESGLSFYHPDPLPYRWIVAALDLDSGRRLSFLLDVDWCRFTRQGWYESGGRILGVVDAPTECEVAACV